MKKIFLILFFIIINITIYGQNYSSDSLINFVHYAIKGNTSQIVKNNECVLLNQFDSISQNITLDYLYNYSNTNLLYSNMSKLYNILDIFAYSKFTNIRQKAINLILEIYRISKSGGNIHRNYKYSDFDDNAKEKILKIVNNEPYNEKELFVLHYKIEQDFKKTYRNDTFYIRKYLKTTKLNIDDLRDSLINVRTEQSMNKLDCKTSYKFELYKIGAGLYMYELIPNFEKLLLENDRDSNVYKLCLARLGNKKYQKEFIDNVYKEGYLNCAELGFINSSKIYKAIIYGLRVKGNASVVVYGLNRATGKYGIVESELEAKKIRNFVNVIYSNIFLSIIPNTFMEKYNYMILETDQLEDLELCEELAKWMEENKDKLQISPDFRY